ncbi:hypothetical protein [Nocardia rhamnosiphila]
MHDPVREIRGAVDRLLAISGTLTHAKIAETCSAELNEIASTNPYVRDFVADPWNGPFSTIRFREPSSPAASLGSLVAMDVARKHRLTVADLTSCFDLSLESLDVNPHIPPEGTLSFQETVGNRLVILEFGALSGLLLLVAVHETDR